MRLQGPPLHVAGLASALPARIIDNETLAQHFPVLTSADIYALTGVHQRRWADPGQTATDLAAQAVERLFAAGISPETVDFLLMCTETPDHLLPASAYLLHQRLHLKQQCLACDINLGCSAWTHALGMAQGLLSAGIAHAGLIITADVISPYVNPRDRSTTLLFGDAATATYVTTSTDAKGLTHVLCGADGSGARHLQIPAGGARLPRSPETSQEYTDTSGNCRSLNDLYMNGTEVLSFTLRQIPQTIHLLLQEAALPPEFIDHWLFHQASKPVLDALQRKFHIPEERFIRCLDRVGNTVGSTIPLALEHALHQGLLHPGQRLLITGFGVGFSWSAALIDWSSDATVLGTDLLA